MFISIIVPTYNRAHLVPRAVESVIHQANSSWELIVVDDGSTDGTNDVMQKYVNDKIRYVRQENAGANRARNHGASLARYEYLTFLDSDDELYPEWLENFLEALKGGSAVVCCGTLRVQHGKTTESLPKGLGQLFGNVPGKFSNGACYAIHKGLFNRIGRFDEELSSGQHTELAYRLASLIVTKEVSVSTIYKPLVKIHIHDGPRIRTNSESKFRGAYLMLTKHDALLRQYPRMKCNYAKITAYHAFKRRYFLISFKTFIIYCKYYLISRLKPDSSVLSAKSY
jgi:glycosyltransferase involved in cell wall biosynthesis